MSRNKTTTPGLRYRVEPLSHRAHLFAVTLDIDRPARSQKLTLPVWIPGSYLVREFSQHLQHLSATQGGEALAVKQLDKHRWQVDNDGQRTLSLRWEVYAFDASVRTAFLDATRGFFNATCLCLMVAGREDESHAIEIQPGDAPAGWQVATGLSPVKANEQGFGTYLAQNYDELADCPVEMGTFWSGEFSACGVPHRFVVSGAGGWFDGQRLLDDTRRICEAQIRFWHGDGQPPYERYVFMLHASGEGYGGLEHRNSTALIAQRTDLPKTRAKDDKPAALKATDGYTTLLGLISHEYFHTWNVKRLRPAEFKRYDYTRENHTELLWFFEGFTSYYDDLFLRRAGLIDDATYLQLVTKTINQVQQSPGQRVQSVAQASFDAWTRYYRVGENTPNATISYYTKGALVAMCLDLTLRAFSKRQFANEIQIARDGEEALAWLPRWAAGEPMPAVILLDINLPRMTGLEVLQAFKRDERARRIPVVVLTSSRDDRDLGKAYDLGVNSYIEKPVSFNKFMEVAGHIELYWCLFNERPYRP